MTGVLFACVAGMFFGALNITMRRGLARVADVDSGSAVIATLALMLVVATAAAFGGARSLPQICDGRSRRA